MWQILGSVFLIFAFFPTKVFFGRFIHNIDIKLMYNELLIHMETEVSMKHLHFSKIFVLILSLFLCLPCFVACGHDGTTVNAKAVVGTVDGEKVYYDELYYLVKNYRSSAEASVGTDRDALCMELDRLVKENITANYAILGLCESNGVTYKAKDFKDAVDEELSQIIADRFGGDENAFRSGMEQVGLTDRYLRYTLTLDLMYSRLLTVYPQNGLVVSGDDELRSYIQNNFIRIYQIACFNDEGDDADANYAKMSEALALLQSGQMSMYDLIGSVYNEDMLEVSGDGYYLIRGTMEPAYEEAAFSLQIGEISGIVSSVGENNMGQVVPCYYIMQRFDLDADYIDTHLTQLQNEYYGSVISADLASYEETLSFVPNEFYASLDLTELLPPEEVSYTWVIVLCSVIGGVLVIAAVTVTVILLKKKHGKKNLIASQKNKNTSVRRKL